mmetsp:Transcript_85338/g.228213  ORF Transcript_85338/g.228213 Transcript_85338/m.228213 type:complete len:205 (+) Transcript_85338:606-1220(+)
MLILACRSGPRSPRQRTSITEVIHRNFWISRRGPSCLDTPLALIHGMILRMRRLAMLQYRPLLIKEAGGQLSPGWMICCRARIVLQALSRVKNEESTAVLIHGGAQVRITRSQVEQAHLLGIHLQRASAALPCPRGGSSLRCSTRSRRLRVGFSIRVSSPAQTILMRMSGRCSSKTIPRTGFIRSVRLLEVPSLIQPRLTQPTR